MPDHDLPAPAVLVRGLSKAYGPVVAVGSLDLRVEAGEIYGLLGPNGAGKTTALECILGLRAPEAGSIEIEGVDARRRPEEARRKMGAQLQGAGLQDPLTPRQALRFFGSFYEQALSPEVLLARFGLAEKADARFETLSTGQRQRLFLAMAFIHRPAVIVLDEPTSGLDPLARRDLHDGIRALRNDGVAVIMSTHDMAEAEQLCSRIGILVSGRLVIEGAPSEIIARSQVGVSLQVRFRSEVPAGALEGLAGTVSSARSGSQWTLQVSNLNQSLRSLTQWAQDSGNEIVDLQVRPPSLEEAFVAATGHRWPSGEGVR